MITAFATVWAIGVLAVISVFPVSAHEWEDDNHSYDKARRAVSRGEALPFFEIRKRVGEQVQGEIIATEYEFEYDRWVYEFKIVDPQGRLRVIHFDAATAERVEGPDDQ